MASLEKTFKKEKNQNIQVFVRLRPPNQRERAIRSLSVVDVVNGREVIVKTTQQCHSKKFTFDRAFGPLVEQYEVYKEVVSPLIAEVLAGYNCTVFAYGQTGTGKTHTMVGENSGEGTTWQNDPLAGIIPRALSQLFDELRISNTEYTVRVSYLELYNEELFDLLSSSDDNSKLRIYEDVTRKGSTIVNGLEEIVVYNKNEVYEIMSRGQEKKKVASTLMNAQSSNQPNDHMLTYSRSHTVFTIVVHMKENCTKGEDLVKIGKLNLVDLAGSENISKAGSDNPAKKERARECVNINQSLLTLGRVITALVEKHPHIPYRESKLTRILQESLGGRTKTSIIATISPGHKDVEETISTLEYANRAKNIQNKPEVNQKMTKQVILNVFAEEVDKLKKELTAAREKNGVYLPTETYEEMTVKREEQRREIQELLLKKRAMEEERARVETIFQEMSARADRAEESLGLAREQLDNTSAVLSQTVQQCAEQKYLVEKHLETEGQLTEQARQLLSTADVATEHVECLHDTVDRRRTVESTNQEIVQAYRHECNNRRQKMVNGVHSCTDCYMGARDELQAKIDDHARDTSLTQELNIQDVNLLVAKMGMFMNEIKTLTAEAESKLSTVNSDCRSQLEASAAARREALQAVLQDLVVTVASCAKSADETDAAATVARCTDQWLSQATARVSCLQRTQGAWDAQARGLEARRGDIVRRHYDDRLAQLQARQAHIQACVAQIEDNKRTIEERMTQQMSTIESERDETERRLQDWVEQERRALEERMARHVEIERNALNRRLEIYIAELERNKTILEESTNKLIELQEMQNSVNREEREMEDKFLEQCKSENEEFLKHINVFAKEFGEGTSGINAEMEAFGSSVEQIVEHTTGLLLGQLRRACDTVEQAAKEVEQQDAAAVRQYTEGAQAAVDAVVAGTSRVLSTVVDKAEESTSSTKETLDAVAERSCRLASSSLSQQQAQSSALERASRAVRELGLGLRDELERQAEAEGRYLMKEYRVYCPSGNTPARREFRYPRKLVATSPHERILSRFRALQQREIDSPDSDCIVVESDEGRHTSDSDVSESDAVSEDSAVAMQ